MQIFGRKVALHDVAFVIIIIILLAYIMMPSCDEPMTSHQIGSLVGIDPVDEAPHDDLYTRVGDANSPNLDDAADGIMDGVALQSLSDERHIGAGNQAVDAINISRLSSAFAKQFDSGVITPSGARETIRSRENPATVIGRRVRVPTYGSGPGGRALDNPSVHMNTIIWGHDVPSTECAAGGRCGDLVEVSSCGGRDECRQGPALFLPRKRDFGDRSYYTMFIGGADQDFYDFPKNAYADASTPEEIDTENTGALNDVMQ